MTHVLPGAEHGRLAVLQWAHARICCSGPAPTDVLQWACARGCLRIEWARHATSPRATGTYLSVLRWVHASGCAWDEHTCANAAHGGQQAALQFARAGVIELVLCLLGALTCMHTARSGHMSVLQWARSQSVGRVGRSHVPERGEGRLPVTLRWLRESSCPPPPCGARARDMGRSRRARVPGRAAADVCSLPVRRVDVQPRR
jgi:hypothetical protein